MGVVIRVGCKNDAGKSLKFAIARAQSPTREARVLPRLFLLISEEAAPANDLGNLRWHHLVPAFVSTGDALEHVP